MMNYRKNLFKPIFNKLTNILLYHRQDILKNNELFVLDINSATYHINEDDYNENIHKICELCKIDLPECKESTLERVFTNFEININNRYTDERLIAYRQYWCSCKWYLTIIKALELFCAKSFTKFESCKDFKTQLKKFLNDYNCNNEIPKSYRVNISVDSIIKAIKNIANGEFSMIDFYKKAIDCSEKYVNLCELKSIKARKISPTFNKYINNDLKKYTVDQLNDYYKIRCIAFVKNYNNIKKLSYSKHNNNADNRIRLNSTYKFLINYRIYKLKTRATIKNYINWCINNNESICARQNYYAVLSKWTEMPMKKRMLYINKFKESNHIPKNT